MSRKSLAMAAFVALVAVSGAGLASDPPAGAPLPPAPTNPGFDRFKGLVGEWVVAEDGPMAKKGELAARYVLTAGGSALVETIFPGSPHEMITVYTPDGQDVVLTHYCVLGNQPRMRAKAPAGSRFTFAFDGGVQPASATHMHQAWVELIGRDEVRSEWTELEGGKPGMVVAMHLLRATR